VILFFLSLVFLRGGYPPKIFFSSLLFVLFFCSGLEHCIVLLATHVPRIPSQHHPIWHLFFSHYHCTLYADFSFFPFPFASLPLVACHSSFHTPSYTFRVGLGVGIPCTLLHSQSPIWKKCTSTRTHSSGCDHYLFYFS